MTRRLPPPRRCPRPRRAPRVPPPPPASAPRARRTARRRARPHRRERRAVPAARLHSHRLHRAPPRRCRPSSAESSWCSPQRRGEHGGHTRSSRDHRRDHALAPPGAMVLALGVLPCAVAYTRFDGAGVSKVRAEPPVNGCLPKACAAVQAELVDLLRRRRCRPRTDPIASLGAERSTAESPEHERGQYTGALSRNDRIASRNNLTRV